MNAAPPLFMTPDEVAELLRTTRKAVYKRLESGLLPGSVRIGRRILFERDVLLNWLRGSRGPSPQGDGS